MSAGPEALINESNSVLKKLCCELAVAYPHDPMVSRAKKRVMLAIDIDPHSVFQTVGRHLFVYRNEIYGSDIKFFIEASYSDEIDNTAKKNQDLANMSSLIISRIKSLISAVDVTRQKAYMGMVQQLLDNYVDFVDATQR